MIGNTDQSSEANRDLDAFLTKAHGCVLAQATAMEEALDRFAQARPDDCPYNLDIKDLSSPGRRTVAQRHIYERGWRLAHLIATNVVDHLLAVGDSAQDPPRYFAHMTLARAALEGAARVSYLLHPTGTTRDRVLRAAALLLMSAEEEIKTTGDLTTRPGLQASAGGVARRHSVEIRRLCEKADIVVAGTGRGSVSVAWLDTPKQSISGSPNITALLKCWHPASQRHTALALGLRTVKPGS